MILTPPYAPCPTSLVDQVADIATQYGKGPLQAVVWDSQIFIDPMLPFGLRLAPKIFSTMADALNWYLHQCGISNILYYLDDFIMIGPPGSPICQESMVTLDRVCTELGVPIAEHKHDGPSTLVLR